MYRYTNYCNFGLTYFVRRVQRRPTYIGPYTGVPLATEPGVFFNNFTTNEDIATKFAADLPHCVRNVKEKNVLLFKFRCNIFIGVRIIKEMPGSVASGTPCITCIFLYLCIIVLSVFEELRTQDHCDGHMHDYAYLP